ncbi:MAG: PHP domain-containing protein, partial [Promethearchaeota archaeon]
MKLDLHIHSIYSDDSSISLDDVIKYSKKRGLDGFAVCDHDNLDAYKVLNSKAKKQNLIAIPGME